MSKPARLLLVLGTLAVVGLVAVLLSSHDPAVPTAPAPRGAFASGRASDEPATLPAKP